MYTTHRDQHSTWSKVFSTTIKRYCKRIFFAGKKCSKIFLKILISDSWIMRKHSPRSQAPQMFLFPWPVLCLGFGLEISWYQKQLPCIKAHQEPEKKHNNNYNKDFFKDQSNYSCKADWIFELKIENGLCYLQLLISLLLLLLLGFPNFRSISFAKISFSQWKCERKLKLFKIFSSDSFEIFAKLFKIFP